MQALTQTLEQLIQVQDHAVLKQSEHLESMLGQLQDYNDRLLNSQHNLAQQKAILESVLDSMSDGVVVANKEGRFILFNPAAERIIGAGSVDISIDEWSSHYALFLDDQKTPFPSADLPLARALGGASMDKVEIYIQRQENLPGKWISVSSRPLQEEDGTVRGGVAILRDITEEKKSRALLERLSSVVEQTDDTVFITDRVGTILYVNPSFERTTGYTSDEAVGRTPRMLKSGKHNIEHYQCMWKALSAGEVFRGAFINRRKNGAIFYCEQTITPMRGSNGRTTHFVSVLKDMTNQRRIKAQEFELKMASVVQKKLFPQQPPNWPTLDVAGVVIPAEATCGDYYDYFLIPQNSYGIAIGDVSGHGLGPALVMAETRAYLRSLSSEVQGIGRLFTRLNRILLEDLEDERFLSLVLLSVDMQKSTLCFANAGHLPAYVLTSTGELKAELKASGPPLGMLSELHYETSQPLPMEHGDLVFMVTDGITERADPDDQFFGMENVLRIVRELRDRPAAEIIHGVCSAASSFSRNQLPLDDMTMVVVKFDEKANLAGNDDAPGRMGG